MQFLIPLSILILIVSLVLFLIVLFIYLFYTRRATKLTAALNDVSNLYQKKYTDFIIKNPYEQEGEYRKAQLHTHTSKSDGKLSPDELVKNYKAKGYSFLAITDHDKITRYHELDDNDFITITGEEMTLSRPFWPLGQHMLRLFVNKHMKSRDLQNIINSTLHKEKGLVVINHPSTISGLGTQFWELEKLLQLNNLYFIEIVNHFSQQENNIKYWHELLKKFGSEDPIWGMASDDAHLQSDIDKDWLMVKVKNISEESLYQALTRGAFYSTQGPGLEFYVNDRNIEIYSDQKLELKIIDANHRVRKKYVGKEIIYNAQGDEGFIRAEGLDLDTGCKAWSQPFWLQEKH